MAVEAIVIDEVRASSSIPKIVANVLK